MSNLTASIFFASCLSVAATVRALADSLSNHPALTQHKADRHIQADRLLSEAIGWASR